MANYQTDEMNVLNALDKLNGYASYGQISAQYRRNQGCEISTERLNEVLDALKTKGWIYARAGDWYGIAPEGKRACHSTLQSPVAEMKAVGSATMLNSASCYGSKTRSTSDDVYCPFCKMYYPFGTVRCFECGATIGATNQARNTPSKVESVEHKDIPINRSLPRNSSRSKREIGVGEIVLYIMGGITALGTALWIGGSSSSVQDSMGTGSGETVNGSTSTTEPFSELSGMFMAEGPIGTTMGIPVTTTTIAAPFAISGSSGGGDVVIWEDSVGNWHIGDNVPYSIVEKRAGMIYDALHRECSEKGTNPLIVAQESEYGTLINRLFANQRTDMFEDKLDLWISLLQ